MFYNDDFRPDDMNYGYGDGIDININNSNVNSNTNANQNVNNKNILTIDDIITTGYTLNEASKILKSGGASNVYCATVAATILKK